VFNLESPGVEAPDGRPRHDKRYHEDSRLAALRAITNGRGSNMFLFTDETKLAAGNPLDVEWVSGKGELVRVTD
jgi:hypothetical protein